MTHLVGALVLGIMALAAPATALADSTDLGEAVLYAWLPITPAQARELTSLFRSPGAVAVDVADTTDTVVETVATLPAGLVHDLVTTPVRHWYLVRGLVTDTVELVARPVGEPRGLFRHTLQALHRSRVFSATARSVRRLTEPRNRTARLAIVLTARAHGLAVQDGHLDALRRAIDRDDPDVGPLLLAVVETLAKMYGRDAVRVILG